LTFLVFPPGALLAPYLPAVGLEICGLRRCVATWPIWLSHSG